MYQETVTVTTLSGSTLQFTDMKLLRNWVASTAAHQELIERQRLQPEFAAPDSSEVSGQEVAPTQ